MTIDPLSLPDKPPRIKAGFTFHYRLERCEAMTLHDHACTTPENAAEFFESSIKRSRFFCQDQECFAVLFLNTRRKITGWNIVSTGTLDTILVHPREVFRVALVTAAAGVILAHNHPSGDPTPSEADIKVTRDLIRAGQLLKIDVLDHIIMGEARPERPRGFVSLRELNYFYT